MADSRSWFLEPGAQLAACVCSLKYILKDDMLCFQPEGANEEQPFQNKNSPAVCFILEHNENRLRTRRSCQRFLPCFHSTFPLPERELLKLNKGLMNSQNNCLAWI